MPTEQLDVDLVPADEDDIPTMAALWAEAFPEKPTERRTRELREGLVYGDLTDCWTVELDGRLAGALRTYRLRMNLRGRTFPTMGLAGVAVAPDFRRRGIGRRMCVEALRIARDRGDALCALFPFRASFYRELGFTMTGELHRYRFAPQELPMYPGWDRVIRAPEQGADEARRIYDAVAPFGNGLLTRTKRMWSFLDRRGTYLYLHRNPRGRSTGYIVVRGRGGPPEKSRLMVRELVAEDREAYLGLLGWLSVQRDQWGAISYDALPGEEMHQRIAHPRTAGSGSPRGTGWFHSAAILRGPMLRILNLETILNPDPGSDGPVRRFGEQAAHREESLQVRDLQLPANQGLWRDGTRVEATLDPSRGAVNSIAEATRLLTAGRLPGQPPPPARWEPNLGFGDIRILDEF